MIATGVGRRVFLVIALSLYGPGAVAAESDSRPGENRAVSEAALAWLVLVDRGQYQRSWEEAAGVLQASVSKERWVMALNKALAGIDAPVSRRLIGATEDKGGVIELKFKTAFGRHERIEEVTMVQQKAIWRAASYLVKGRQD